MGNGGSAEKLKSKKVSLRLSLAKKKEDEKLKLLLLGAGESGKSTIFKQMRLLYGSGFTDEERFKMRPFLISNLIEGAIDIFEAGEVVGIEIKGADAVAAGKMLAELSERRALTEDVAEAINVLWNDSDFRKIYEQRSKFQLQDTWHLFADSLKNYPQWGGPDWTPTTEEILLSRVRTTGIVDEEFLVKGAKLRMLDVGGQRNERRKWIHSFEGVTSVIFVAALSEYDQVLFEDSSQNRLVESLELFKEIGNSKWFKDSALILFLNKSDLFEEKYLDKQIPLNISGLFPSAPSGPPDLEKAYDWFEKMFRGQLSEVEIAGKKKRRTVYVHVTCATDTQAIDKVMKASSQHILRQNLAGAGIIS